MATGWVREPDKDKDRILTWRVALVGLVSVLLAGAIGAGSSIWTSSQQISGSSDQSRTDFLREQRLTSYTTYMVDMQNAVDLSRIVLNSKSSDKDYADNRANLFDKLEPKIAYDVQVLYLVGPRDVAEKASDLYNKSFGEEWSVYMSDWRLYQPLHDSLSAEMQNQIQN